MNTAVINVKTDPKLKQELKAVAKELGLSVGAIINAYVRELVRERRVVFSAPPALNHRTKSRMYAFMVAPTDSPSSFATAWSSCFSFGFVLMLITAVFIPKVYTLVLSCQLESSVYDL